MSKYVKINPTTNEVLRVIPIDERFGLPPNVILVDSLPKVQDKKARVLQNGEVIFVADYRDKTVYSTTNVEDTEIVTYTGDIKAGWTLDAPVPEIPEPKPTGYEFEGTVVPYNDILLTRLMAAQFAISKGITSVDVHMSNSSDEKITLTTDNLADFQAGYMAGYLDDQA